MKAADVAGIPPEVGASTNGGRATPNVSPLPEARMKRRSFVNTGLAAMAGLAFPAQTLSALATAPPRGWRDAALARAGCRRDVVAVTGDGEEVVLTSEVLTELARRIRGRLLLADDEGYEDARLILNPSFDRHPALIAQVTGAADIQHAVEFAQEHGGLLLAVKCGGHSFSGQSTCDRGMMIDLSPFRHVRVDPEARRAWVSGGSLLGAVDHETMAHGLVTPLGTVSHTGAGGLVTGGGFGRLSRRLGLSIDNLESVDVVTADGRLLHASERENEDLFWGVRGGGGNFGVVTSFELRLHPMQREVVAGRIMFPIERARDLLETYAEYAPRAPEALQLDLGIMIPPAGVELPPGGERGIAAASVCFSGPAGEAERALAPIRRLGTPLLDEVQVADYVEVQRSGDADDPRAQAYYLYGGFVPEVPSAMIDTIVEGLEGHPDRQTQVVFVQAGGAISRVRPQATAFYQRDAEANVLCMAGWRHGTDPSPHVDWIRGYWPSLERFTHGFYVNDANPDQTGAAIQNAYQDNHERLVQVKNRYDPTNLFRLNANIRPTVG
jgi:FAD/FMN-containing dehydrogenase